jgi:hypothetical protein
LGGSFSREIGDAQRLEYVGDGEGHGEDVLHVQIASSGMEP